MGCGGPWKDKFYNATVQPERHSSVMLGTIADQEFSSPLNSIW